MINTALFFLHYTLLLLFGILLSAVFAGVRLTGKNVGILTGLFAFCGIIQLIAYSYLNETTVWQIYPLITHLPIILFLCTYYRKRLSTSLAAVATAYLCCQPAKWFGLLMASLTGNYTAEQITRILTLFLVAAVAAFFLGPYVSDIYNKETCNVLLFGIVPMVYYLFDYATGIYTDFWLNNNQIAIEFLPFFLCIVHIAFCVIYYKEYEKKSDAERKEQLIRMTAEQQTKEIEAIKRSEQEIRMLRHDMRLLLNNLALCMEVGDIESAQKMISGFTRNVDSTVVHRYCENATVNYIISDCAARCQAFHISFLPTVEIKDLPVDEILFASILSNALDNAINAQLELAKQQRNIKVMLKLSDGRLLLSVKNPYDKAPHFADGMPISPKKGHGYGTQSIRYITERLGGNCQFMLDNENFVLRVVI